MCRLFGSRQFAASGPALLLVAVMAGCHAPAKPCEDITPGAIPQPNGAYACQWINAERDRADRDNFVIYQYEWSSDAKKLTSSGEEHLARLAQGLGRVPFPIVIEPSADPRVDKARRMAVLEFLANCRVQISPDRVVLGRSDAEGLYGDETPAIARGMFNNPGAGQGGGGAGGGMSGSNTGGMAGSSLGGTSTSGGGAGIY